MGGKNSLFMLVIVFLLVVPHSAVIAQERARAELKNAEGKAVGTADLRQTKEGVVIALRLTGLPPGLHAVHIHSVGKCEAPTFASARRAFQSAEHETRIEERGWAACRRLARPVYQ
jgi:Cu/Zn superoxide dismutase